MSISLEQLKAEISSWFKRRALVDSTTVAYEAAALNAESVHMEGESNIQQAEAEAEMKDNEAVGAVSTAAVAKDAAVANERSQAAYIAGLLGLEGYPVIPDPSPDEDE